MLYSKKIPNLLTSLQKKNIMIEAIYKVNVIKEKPMSLKEKFNLYDLNDQKLSNSKMRSILAGYRICGCACYFADSGGSIIEDNCDANYESGDDGLWSPYPIRCFRDEFMSDRSVFE